MSIFIEQLEDCIDLDELKPSKALELEVVSQPRRWSYRSYQVQGLREIASSFQRFKRVLIVLATGCGKTVIFTKVAKGTVEAGGRVLIIAHSDVLLEQAAEKLGASTGLKAAKEKGSTRASPWDSVVVASVQTLSRAERLSTWAPDHFDLVIVDEAHRSLAKSYVTILEHFKCKVLGVTATADRGDKKNLSEMYEACAFDYGLLQAVQDGWLVRIKVQTIPLEIDLRGVKASRTSQGSDFDLGEVSHRIEPFIGKIAHEIRNHTYGRGQGVIFMPSVHTSDMMAQALVRLGIKAEYVSGACTDQDEKVKRFLRGDTTVLINAMLLIEGFDHDRIYWVCVLRPTKIRSLYVQAVGRGTRPLSEIVAELNAAQTAEERRAIIRASGKPDLMILDFLWLTEKLDLIAPVHLVAKNQQVAEQALKKRKDGDLMDIEQQAQRDLLKALEKAVKENAKKQGKMIDPLAMAVSLGDEDILKYEPQSRADFAAPSAEQVKKLNEHKLDVTKFNTFGLAARVLEVIERRKRLGLCSPRQLCFLEKLGIPHANMRTAAEFKAIFIAKKKEWDSNKFPKPNAARSTPTLPAEQPYLFNP
jgi:superfamily II DNA or RNA helicase